MSSPEFGLVEDADARLEQRHLQHLESLLLAPGKADVQRPPQHLLIDFQRLRRFAHTPHEFGRREIAFSSRTPVRVERRLQKSHRADAGNFRRILKRQKHAPKRALVRLELQQVFSVEPNLAGRDLIVRLAGNDVGQGRLARAVRPHDRRDLARIHAETEAVQNRLVLDRNAEVLDFEHRDSTRLLV